MAVIPHGFEVAMLTLEPARARGPLDRQEPSPFAEGWNAMTGDDIALIAAQAIEAEFAAEHLGGATQRRAKIQRIILDAIDEAAIRAMPLQQETKP